MRVLAIDPGTHQSAFVVWNSNPGHIERCGIEPNDTLVRMLQFRETTDMKDFDVAAIEMVAGMGMIVGQEVFDTCVWIGRMYERCRPEPRLVYRRHIKLHHCQSARAKDSNIRQALIDKHGAPGTKHAQGVTYGLKSHLWQAFALATFISETAETQSVSSKVEDASRTDEIAGVPPVCAAV